MFTLWSMIPVISSSCPFEPLLCGLPVTNSALSAVPNRRIRQSLMKLATSLRITLSETEKFWEAETCQYITRSYLYRCGLTTQCCGTQEVKVLNMLSWATKCPEKPTTYKTNTPEDGRNIFFLAYCTITKLKTRQSVTCCSCLVWHDGRLRHDNCNPVPLTTKDEVTQ